MVRKKIFEITHTVYTGMPLLPGLDRKTKYLPNGRPIMRFDALAHIDDAYYIYMDVHNLYLLMSRPFGKGSVERS